MRIGWIGTGIMGREMAGRLLVAGHELHVFNRTRAKAQPLIDRGASWEDSPAAVGAASDTAFTMVGVPTDVREVVLGRGGLLEGMATGGMLIDCTTSSPSLAVEIAGAAKEKGIGALDAPVSGGEVGARGATLSVMVGGEPAVFEQARPLFEKLGKTVVYQGPPGSGQHTKMVNQILVASGMLGVCEGLIYARANGLDPERVLQSVRGGAAGSWSLEHYYPRMLRDDMSPGFQVEHFIKDLEIALRESERRCLHLPGLLLVHQLYLEVLGMGLGRCGTQSLLKAIQAASHRTGGARQ